MLEHILEHHGYFRSTFPFMSEPAQHGFRTAVQGITGSLPTWAVKPATIVAAPTAKVPNKPSEVKRERPAPRQRVYLNADNKLRLIADLQRKLLTQREIADKYGVSPSCVYEVNRKYRR